MVEFLYHGEDVGESPFAEVIAEIAADGGDVSIACPFLNLEVLESLAHTADGLRILTDFEAWFSAGSSASRADVRGFVEEQAGSVRDLPGLHAKLVLGDDLAYLGSANLTKSGLATNRELGVTLTRSDELRQLHDWFEFVWELGTHPTADEVDVIFESTSVERETTGRFSNDRVRDLNVDARVNSSLTAILGTGRDDNDLDGAAQAADNEARDRLIERLSQTPGRWWARRYFDLVERLLDATSLESGDPRLVTTIPKSYERLCVSINNRYVFTGMWQDDSDFGFMVGPDFELPEELQENVVYPGYGYNPHAQETEAVAPRFLAFEVTEDTAIPDVLIDDWIRYMKLEVEYRSGSMFQQYHEPIVCRAARNETFRDELMTAAFEDDERGTESQ